MAIAGFLAHLAPETVDCALQVSHGGQQLEDGDLGWGPNLALDRDGQVFQGEGFPSEPRGPAPQATPGSGAWPCVPTERTKACVRLDIWAGGVCGQQLGPSQAGPWASQGSSGARPSLRGQVGPEAVADGTSALSRAGPPHGQVTLLDGELSCPSPGRAGGGLQVTLLLQACIHQLASCALRDGAQAGAPLSSQVGLDSARLLTQHGPRGGGDGRPSPLGLARAHPPAMVTAPANISALQESPLL